MRSLLLTALLVATSFVLPDNHLIGQKVMVIHWDSKLTDGNNKLTTPVFLGDIFTVEKVDGRLLWVKRGWIHDTDVMSIDDALKYFTTKIDAHPNSPTLYNDRARGYTSLGEFDKAIADEDKSIELCASAPPQILAGYYEDRGTIWLSKRAFDRAIHDYDRAIELDPDVTFVHNNRGLAYRHIGKYEKALEDFDKEIQRAPNDPYAYENRAWILATCPDSGLRDPDKAVESATHACDLSGWHTAGESIRWLQPMPPKAI
jgi:tetratricopeptide (TPR) repeat protein